MSSQPDKLAHANQVDDLATRILTCILDESRLVKATFSGHRRNMAPPWRRVEMRYVDLKAGSQLQVVEYDRAQAFTKNLSAADAGRHVRDLLAAGFGHWYVETTTETFQIRFSKRGRPLVSRTEPVRGIAMTRQHDHPKRRLLSQTDPLFAALGITTADGRVKPSRTAKFRQVQDMLAALDPVVDALRTSTSAPQRGPVRVVDLGCGNAYLTFAAYRYLRLVHDLPVEVIGIDVRAQARQHNAEIAAVLGISADVSFIDATIDAVDVEPAPDLVLALHACDTATDDALARAVAWGAPVVLAAPCCHHDLQRQLGGDARDSQAYRLITRHGILRERFADILTDALRASILRQVGYRVDVVEFVDSKHTPRNVLIRAVRTGSFAERDAIQAYRELVTGWGVRPALVDALSAFGVGLPDLDATG